MKALFIIGFVALGWYLRGEKFRIREITSQAATSQIQKVSKVVKQEYAEVKPKVAEVVKEVVQKVEKIKPKASYVTKKVVVNDVTYSCTEFKSSKIQFKRCDKLRN